MQTHSEETPDTGCTVCDTDRYHGPRIETMGGYMHLSHLPRMGERRMVTRA